MIKNKKDLRLDELDRKLIGALMKEGRAGWVELAERFGLSSPAISERVRRLEERGVIKGYAALVEPELLDCALTAFVAVTLQQPKHRAPFLALVNTLDDVQECHHIAGDDDYLLKVRCRNTRALDDLISNRIKSLAGIARTRTTIALFTLKESPVLPLEAGEEER